MHTCKVTFFFLKKKRLVVTWEEEFLKLFIPSLLCIWMNRITEFTKCFLVNPISGDIWFGSFHSWLPRTSQSSPWWVVGFKYNILQLSSIYHVITRVLMNAYFNLNKIIKKRRGGDQSTDCTMENGLKSVYLKWGN